MAVVVDIESGAPGGRDRDVIMPIGALRFDATTRQGSTRLTAEEIEALPLWDDD